MITVLRKIISLLLIVATFMLSMCVSCSKVAVTVNETGVEDIREEVFFETDKPSKVHLTDGSYVDYPLGFKVDSDTIITPGIKYNMDTVDSSTVAVLSVNHIVRIEYYRTDYELNKSLGYFLGFGLVMTLLFYLVHYMQNNTIDLAL